MTRAAGEKSRLFRKTGALILMDIHTDENLTHIAFIMDGNGRWAKARGKERQEGHKEGVKTFEKIAEACFDAGFDTVTFYAFSTENWKRPPKEIKTIMSLLRIYLDKSRKTLKEKNAKLKVIGDVSAFDKPLREKILKIEKETENYPHTLNIALNYGGRDELVHAFRKILESGEEINERTISDALYTSSDPDMIVRTGGEKRLSNFLLWQASYSELYFTDVLWPDFGEAELELAIKDFYSRKRRYGGV